MSLSMLSYLSILSVFVNLFIIILNVFKNVFFSFNFVVKLKILES